jgi:negative regulator of sigma E activity
MKPINETDLEQLSAFIDGELSDSERRFFQKRLASDSELRAACERAWIASSVLKSHPIHLMPSSCADDICARCDELPRPGSYWRWVASFAALAVAFGLGVQMMPDKNDTVTSMTQTMAVTATQNPVPTLPASPQQPEADRLASASPLPVDRSSVNKNTPRPAPIEKPEDGDPSQFALNEAVLAKSWPERDSAMQGYLVRHNQMAGNSAGNDLISYAELLAEPASADSKPAQDQQ